MSQDPWQVPESEIRSKREAIERQIRQQREFERGHGQQPKLVRLLVFLMGIGLMLFGLSLAFPLYGNFDPYLIRSLIILGIFGGAAAFWSRASIAKIAKVTGLWIVIIIGISFFYLYRSDLGERFMSSVDPSGVISTNEGLIVHRAKDGHFWVRARINGSLLRLMVDTGASSIVLSPDDAEKAGFASNTLKFSQLAETANGKVPFARATATTMSLGDTTFYDVPITVNGVHMEGSLMGMSALKNFSSVEFRGNKLILRN